MLLDTTVGSIAAVFFKKEAIITGINGQKALYWRLSKVILSGMYCNFAEINWVLSKRLEKLEMEYELFLCTTIFYLIPFKI